MKKGKEPTYPVEVTNKKGEIRGVQASQYSYFEMGLTKREYFAGLAMQGLLARNPNRQNGETDLGMLEANRIAEESVVMADFILKELEKEDK